MPKLIDDSLGPIGSVMSSMLTETEFQNLHGTGWILADGRTVSGSKYATIKSVTTVPDMRGMVLRGKNNSRADGNQNPDGEIALGTFQADMYTSHNHSAPAGGTFVLDHIGGGLAVGSGPYADSSAYSTVTNSGGNETRMKNVTVNHFIRIN